MNKKLKRIIITLLLSLTIFTTCSLEGDILLRRLKPVDSGIAIPQRPTAPVVTASNESLAIQWSSVESATAYEIWMSTLNDSNTAVKYGADVTGSLSAVISGLNNGITYYIWIKAKNDIGVSGFSPVASGTPLASTVKPPDPKIAPTVIAGDRQLTVSWQAVEGTNAYEIWMSTANDSSTAEKYGTDVTGSLSVIISGLNNGTTYYIWIKAKNDIGVSDFSPVASGKPEYNFTPGLYRNAVKIGTHNLADSLTYISANAVSGDDFYIVLGANESSPPKTLDYSGKTVKITLFGYSSERTITLNANGSMFTVNPGITLTLDKNITLVGRNANSATLVYVYGGNLIMNEGAKISGNTANNGSGGGVWVNFGTFIMNGGEIIGNNVTSTSNHGQGGGVCVSGGSFTMNGGKITGNSAISFDPSYGGMGGGICVRTNGNFIMYGGAITGNTAGSSTSNGWGGGGFVSATFIMYGGIISGNSAGTNSHGGLYITLGTFKKLSPIGGQNSGIIYGPEAVGADSDGIPLKNTPSTAICTEAGYRRNITAGENDQIDTTTGKGLSTNGNPPYGQ